MDSVRSAGSAGRCMGSVRSAGACCFLCASHCVRKRDPAGEASEVQGLPLAAYAALMGTVTQGSALDAPP